MLCVYNFKYGWLKMRNRSELKIQSPLIFTPLNRIEATNLPETRRKYTNKYIP